MNPDQNREEFEEWAKNEGYQLTHSEYAKEIYACALTRCAWEAWQAARDQPKGYCTCGNPSQHITGWNSNLCYDCRKPILVINGI